MRENIDRLIFEAIDGIISPDDFERLQDAIEQDDEVRAAYLQAINLTESLTEIATSSSLEFVVRAPQTAVPGQGRLVETRRSRRRRFFSVQLAVTAVVLLLAAGVGFWLGQRNRAGKSPPVAGGGDGVSKTVEDRIAGHATLRRTLDVQWPPNETVYREGDVLPEGLLKFAGGIAEIDFFCGASLIVEGPAALEVESDWSVRVLEGRLRAYVPPAARGFIVKAAGSEIVDLGTEFALEVGGQDARVEVLDGEVELRSRGRDRMRLTTGQRQSLGESTGQPQAIEGLSTVAELLQRRKAAEQRRFAAWKQYAEQLRRDERLIAYYPIAASPASRTIRNTAGLPGARDGHLVGTVEWTTGRFGAESAGLEFSRPGARVRTRIDGEFQAFTFACWAKINSLEHRYNALFMADGYENGEPHWQIRDDGRLMLSVMVDDTQEVRHFSEIEQRMVTGAGLHRVYYSEPFWDISKSGQWFHLAAVYDPAGRRVVHYVNGKPISSEKIIDKFHVTTLRIGPAEIGNWGQPFRKTPWFAVRHLNGTIDELAIWNAALTSEEIKDLYEQGKPVGY